MAGLQASDRVQAALDGFLRGELALSELQSELGAILAAQPDAAALIGDRLDELYRGGHVPLQVHRILSALVGRETPAAKAFPPPFDDGDATRNDATRRRPVGGSEPAWGDSSAPAVPPEERTVVPADNGDATRRPPGMSSGATLDTGSNWSHPEEWSSRGDAVLGVGSVIKDRFVLDSVLGQGGMGVVYRALDRRKEEAQDSDLYVAIKILNDEFRHHPKALVALQREARKAQTLAHPNIITVHDFDRDGTTVYMTMELLDGEPLSSTIKANKIAGLSPDRALPIIRGIGTALAYAHRKDIVHSDLKPGNVFVTGQGDVKVLDFGIARAVPSELRPAPDKFDAAELGALTPAYASPEMLRGQPPVPADDVFALGVVAHELLTGRHPFDRLPADQAQQRAVEPAALRMLPRRQRVALAKALSFERKQRHANATTFLAHFDGPSPLRKAAYAATLLALAGVAGYAFYLNTQARPDVPLSDLPLEAQQEFKKAIDDGAQGLKFGALNDAFELYSRAYEIHRNDPEAIDGLEQVADRFLAGLPQAETADRRALMQKLYCQEYLATYRPVVKACQGMLGAQCSVAGLSCPRSDTRP